MSQYRSEPDDARSTNTRQHRAHERAVHLPPLGLAGTLRIPEHARGVVIFAHGSGSSRFSPRNIAVAHSLNDHGYGTLLLGLLTDVESRDRRNVFDIPLLAERLLMAVQFLDSDPDAVGLPIGLFGASTGAGAALVAAAELGRRVGAIVSRGGRPDLAGSALDRVISPTLLIVGGADSVVAQLNRAALTHLRGDSEMTIVPGATHLFEERGALEEVMRLANEWFSMHLAPRSDAES